MGCRTFLLSTAVSLALAPAALADSATNDLFLARDACGGSTPANLRLSADLGAFTSSCGSVTGVVSPSVSVYPSATGAAQTLDVSRKVYVAVVLSDFSGAGVGLGGQTVDVKLTAKDAKSKVVTLGSATDTKDPQTMLRGANYTAEFELPLTAAQKGPYKSFTLTLTVGGSEFAGYVDHGGGSFVSVPILGASRRPVNKR